MYDYEWLGYGLLLRLPNGTVFMQGDEASELYDQLESITDEATLEMVLSEYSEAAEPDCSCGRCGQCIGDE